MRMELTPEEVKAVQRMREIEDAHRSGWNKALAQIELQLAEIEHDHINDGKGELESVGAKWLRGILQRMARG